MKTSISVIIPVYNSAEFLEKCVSSVICQTLTDIQLILVDDGSTDGSSGLCDAMAKNDNRIVVIHQENSGASEARNAGLSLAEGEYISFVDSDDSIDCEMLQTLYECVKKHDADIATCNFRAISGDSVRENVGKMSDGIKNFEPLDMYEFNRSFGQQSSIFLWNSIYRRSIIEDNRLSFISMKKVFSEDQLFNLCFYAVAKRACYINKSMYNYIIRQNSLCHTAGKIGIIDKRITLVRELNSFLKSRKCAKQPFYFYATLMWQYFISGCATFSDREVLYSDLKNITDNRHFFRKCLLNLLFGASGNKYVKSYNMDFKSVLYFKYMVVLMLFGKYDKPVDTFLLSKKG